MNKIAEASKPGLLRISRRDIAMLSDHNEQGDPTKLRGAANKSLLVSGFVLDYLSRSITIFHVNLRESMIKNNLFFLFMLLASSPAFSYWANCHAENDRLFSIFVKDKILTVNRKYEHYFEGVTSKGWYVYSNSKYTYRTGPFTDNGFRIYVINSEGQGYGGWCNFL